MVVVDFLALDRQIERASFERERSEREYGPQESPLEFHRAVSGIRAIETLMEATPSIVEVPIRDAMRPWLAELLVARLSYSAARDFAEVLRTPSVIPPAAAGASAHTRVSWTAAWTQLLSSNPGGASAWQDSLAEAGPVIGSAARELRGRCREVEARVVEKLGRFPEPMFEQLGQAVPAERTASLAEGLLQKTDDLASDIRREAHRRATSGASVGLALRDATSPAGVVIDALAREATSSFPARIRGSWFDDLFGAQLRGVHATPSLPSQVFGAASFVLALSSFGRALRLGLASRGLPFVLRRTPASIDAERFASVFGTLAASERFLRHALGSTPTRAREDRRVVGRTLVFETRLRATRVLLERDESRFEELTARLFGRPLPDTLRGAWPLPRRRGEAGARAELLGACSSLDLSGELVDRFDEDWFRNPRAFEWMRARGSIPAAPPAGTDAVSAPESDDTTIRRVTSALQGIFA